MKSRNRLYWLLVSISAATVVSGLVQVVTPGFVLGLVGGDSTPTSRHFFGIVGMFMALFGSLLLQALLSPEHHPVSVFWAGLQKLGAFVAVGLGVQRGLFARIALAVAFFDLLSGILILAYWRSMRAAPPR
jgi:hypothetical protein